jgi:hypothetical protein
MVNLPGLLKRSELHFALFLIRVLSYNILFKSGSYDIEVSHWFHGRTGGLLGVHDNERFDDMMTSDRQITSDAYALANTWQVQDKCNYILHCS